MINKNILLLSLVTSILVCVQQRMSSSIESVILEYAHVHSLSGMETIREVTDTERRVVFRHVRAGFANNMMGLLASYVKAIVGNLPLK